MAPPDHPRSRIAELRAKIKRGAHRIRRIVTFNRRRRKAIKHLRSELGPRLGIDVAWGSPSIGALRDAGVSFVCRYLSRDPSKNLTPAEAQEYGRAGIDTIAVWEGTAAEAEGGRAAAREDAGIAVREARACGKPEDRPIFFAIDFEASLAQVRPYFEELNRLLDSSRVGAYGGYQVIHELFEAGLIRYGWQTYAWSGGRWEPRAQLRQYSNGHTLDGVSIDFDRSVDADFGQWRPA